MPLAKLTSKGQTTIPGEIRRHLNLKPGDKIEFIIEKNGRVSLFPASIDLASLEGLLAPAPRRASLREMDEAIRKAAAQRYRRATRKGK